MSVWTSSFPISEIQLDEAGNGKGWFKTNLPHHKFIADTMCASWNNKHMERRLVGPVSGIITSVEMTCYVTEDGESRGRVTAVCAPGFRLTHKRRVSLCVQLIDGLFVEWAKEFLGPKNVMRAPDGTRLMVT